jgi:hypothetical protein
VKKNVLYEKGDEISRFDGTLKVEIPMCIWSSNSNLRLQKIFSSKITVFCHQLQILGLKQKVFVFAFCGNAFLRKSVL